MVSALHRVRPRSRPAASLPVRTRDVDLPAQRPARLAVPRARMRQHPVPRTNARARRIRELGSNLHASVRLRERVAGVHPARHERELRLGRSNTPGLVEEVIGRRPRSSPRSHREGPAGHDALARVVPLLGPAELILLRRGTGGVTARGPLGEVEAVAVELIVPCQLPSSPARVRRSRFRFDGTASEREPSVRAGGRASSARELVHERAGRRSLPADVPGALARAIRPVPIAITSFLGRWFHRRRGRGRRHRSRGLALTGDDPFPRASRPVNRVVQSIVPDPAPRRTQRRRRSAQIRASRVGGRGPKVSVGMLGSDEPAVRRGEVVSDLRRLDGDDRYQQDRRDERDRHSRGRARPLPRAHAVRVCDEV